MTDLKLARMENGRPEIFRSVQGEGPMRGMQRTFVRLSGCNLHCVWCDTAYTWNWRGSPWRHEQDRPGAPHKFDPTAEMTKRTVRETAALVRACGADALVISGGEPLLQRDGVFALARELPESRIEIETNGTIAPSAALAARVALFVVSPKLAHAENDQLALRDEALAAFAANEAAVFKFVVRRPDDLEDVRAIVSRFDVPATRVWIMPEGVTSDVLQGRGRALIGDVIAAGWNYSDRLHIDLFGAKRGV